jgi:hypothetical protein
MVDMEGQPNIFNLEVPGVGHGELLTRRAVYEVIRRELALGYDQPAPPSALRMLPQPASAS